MLKRKIALLATFLALLLLASWLIRGRKLGGENPGDQLRTSSHEIKESGKELAAVARSPKPSADNSKDSRPGVLDETFIEKTFIPKLLESISRDLSLPLPGALTRFKREEVWRLREGRLIALLYPEMLERIMVKLALDPNSDGGVRYFAMYMLGYLTETGHEKARDAMLQLIKDHDHDTAYRALDVLASADRTAQFRDIYIQSASEGNSAGIAQLSYSGDSQTSAFLKSIVGKPLDGTTNAYEVQASARRALEKVETLQSPDWQIRLADIVLKQTPYLDVSWALEAARRNSFENFPDLLRQSLDIQDQRMKDLYDAVQSKSALPETQRISFETVFASQASLNAMPKYFDDELVTQLQVGGPLTNLERGRLRTFGYGCDPKERLQELVSTGR